MAKESLRKGGGGGGGGASLEPQEMGNFLYTQKNMYSTKQLDDALGSGRTQQMLYSVANTLSEFGLQDNVVQEIGAQDIGKSAYAFSVTNGNQLRINTRFFKDEQKVSKMYQEDVAAGFHPKGTTAEHIIVHEAGHNVMYALEAKNAGAVERVFRQARKESGEKNQLRAAKTISGYASKNKAECFAEAVADYMANGSKATKFSQALVKYAKEELAR